MATLKSKKTAIIMALLTLLFVVPFFAAWLTYSKGIFLSGRKVNHGLLLQPPLALSSLSLIHEGQNNTKPLNGKWVLLYLSISPDDPLLDHNLYYMRQIRQATGKNRDRIERALVTLTENSAVETKLQTAFKGTQHFIISQAKYGQFESRLPKKLALKKGSLYLVDPLGNIILSYAPDAAPKGILKDLERVLKVSQIG